jgi:hypothetical protein
MPIVAEVGLGEGRLQKPPWALTLQKALGSRRFVHYTDNNSSLMTASARDSLTLTFSCRVKSMLSQRWLVASRNSGWHPRHDDILARHSGWAKKIPQRIICNISVYFMFKGWSWKTANNILYLILRRQHSSTTHVDWQCQQLWRAFNVRTARHFDPF